MTNKQIYLQFEEKNICCPKDIIHSTHDNKYHALHIPVWIIVSKHVGRRQCVGKHVGCVLVKVDFRKY